MTLYWYMHWFWITITISHYVACEDMLNMTMIHSTTPPADQDVHRSAKSIELMTSPPASSSTPARSMQNNTRPLDKQSSVIELNVTLLSDNQTLENLTTERFNLSSDLNSTGNEPGGLPTTGKMELEMADSSGGNLSVAGITGITLGCVSFVGILTAVSFLVYRNRGLNRPQVLTDRCSNLDSSGYIDDTSVRDNSEEMYSLDNDSFLNSLEAMTIQNYWTDVKHTKL